MFTKVLIAEDFDSINIALIQTLESMGVKEIEHAKYCDDALLKAKKAIQDKVRGVTQNVEKVVEVANAVREVARAVRK